MTKIPMSVEADNPLALTPEEEVEFLRNQIEKIRVAQGYKDRVQEETFKSLVGSVRFLCNTIKTMASRLYTTEDQEAIIGDVDKILEKLEEG